MKRRTLLSNLLALGSCGKFVPRTTLAFDDSAPLPSDPDVKRVLVMFKCHLDVGFVDTQANIIQKYFEVFFPHAIEIAETMRKSGADRYTWTTGSWLIYNYLEKAEPAQRRRMEQAIADGDIAWHALPFTWQTELLEPSLIEGALGFAQSLDRRFSRKTTGAKMTDVPGHTRAIVGPLATHGVTFLDIGVNSASTAPDVPPVFVWQDPQGRSLVMMYHHRDYGGCLKVPGSDLAIDIEVRGDNQGPHTIAEIQTIYKGLRARFPNAEIKASNLSAIANAVQPYCGRLPVVTQEIGDTWIYGVASDPVKVARYLEIVRLRNEWIANGKLKPGDAADLAFLRQFLLEVEHTWGTDTKTWLDFDHYTPADLVTMLDHPKYKVVQFSWAEKRQDLFDAIAALPEPLRAEAGKRVESLRPAAPDTKGMRPHPAANTIDAKHFQIALDPKTGAICRLLNKKTGYDWATPSQPLALFCYQTLSKADYDRFFVDYLKSKADWAPKDFGKPNIERFGAQSRTWMPALSTCSLGRDARGQRIIAALSIDATPQLTLFLEMLLPDAEPVVDLRLSWFGKRANRMPEAFWLSFRPRATDPGAWTLIKSGAAVRPSEVITGGNRAMHAVLGGVRYAGADGSLAIESLDAPLVALGERTPLRYTRDQPDLAQGIHFNLFNNAWGTNYIQWFGEDMSFRFRIA
jgi:hypothetical protein